MTLESKSSGTDPGLFETILGDGRPLLVLTGASLMFSGGFALFLSAGRQFLPQDLAFLGMTPAELCRLNGCRVLDFMIHDRVAFGGALIAIGSLFVWLAIFPLGEGEGWAWWTFILSGAIGFGSFLAYLGFGYLDTWHGVGTLLLLPVFALGLVRSRRLVAGVGPGVMLRPRAGPPWASQSGLGRGLMLVAAAGMTLGGFTILWVGVTRVFVSQDLGFTGTTRMALDALNPRIVPLLAHDRAGFGGAVCTTGLTAFFCVWCGRPSRSLWQVLVISWAAASFTAIGIHFLVGYVSAIHLAPAVLGAIGFGVGLALSFKEMMRSPTPRTSLELPSPAR